MKNLIKKLSKNEDSYWFLRWIAMRYERNQLLKELETLKACDMTKAFEENAELRKTLEEIRNDYQPIKNKIHNGVSRKKGYGRK